MSFRFIRNRTQNIAVKGFLITLAFCVVVALFVHWSIEVTTPFLLGWIMVWLIGASAHADNNRDNSSSAS